MHGAAWVADDRLIAYVSSGWIVTDWHGRRIGLCYVTGSWFVNSWQSDRRYSVRITLDDGRVYVGRTFGKGMVVHAKRAMWKGKPVTGRKRRAEIGSAEWYAEEIVYAGCK